MDTTLTRSLYKAFWRNMPNRSNVALRRFGIWMLLIGSGVAALFLMVNYGFGKVSPGTGRVLNLSTKAPIEGAAVTMDCRKRNYGIGHGGSSTLRTITVTSDKNGAYAFSPIDVLGCTYAIVRGEKTGFIEPSGIYPEYQFNDETHIPGIIYLVPAAAEVMFRR